MTSSTTRAFMAKKQSTSFAQVATNLLNVLQGYTKTIRLLLVMFLTLTVTTNAWGETWEKATSISAGDVVLLVCESKKMELSGISTTSTKYGIGTAYTTTPAGLYELTVEAGSTSGTYSFKKDNNYLYWNSGNSLATNTTKNANTSWTVTFSNGTATIKNAKEVTRVIGWNASSPRFACYTSSQTAVQLYKKVIAAAKTLSSIAVSGQKTEYTVGDEFVKPTVTATYSDATTADVTSSATCSGYDMSSVGEQPVTVSYTEGSTTKTATYNITVSPAQGGGNSGDGEWVETEIANISSTDVVVVTMTNSSGTYAMSNNNGTSSAPTATKVTVSGKTLSGEIADALQWNISNSNGSLTFYPNGTTEKWLYCTSTNNGVRVGTNTAKAFAIDATSGYLKHTGTSRYIGVYNSADWRCYTSYTTDNIKNQTLKFYKKTVSTPVNTYTLTNKVSPAGYGTVSHTSVEDIPEGTSITKSNNTYTVNGTKVTATPTAATAQYTYVFSEWQNLPATVNNDATVTAVFTRTTNKYTITWKNADGTTLKTDSLEYGATPSYDGTPTQEATAQYTYEFAGWDPEISTVTGDRIYTATYTSTIRQYTVTFDNNGHGNKPANQTVNYNGNATNPGNLSEDGFFFKGWYDNSGNLFDFENTKITGPTTITAKWCEILGDAAGLTVQTDCVEDGLTYVKFSWTPADNTLLSENNKQKICIRKTTGDYESCKEKDYNINWTGDLRSKLSPGVYEWTIQAIGDGTDYCDGEVIAGENFIIVGYVISFDTDGGDGEYNDVTIFEGETYTIPVAPTKTGYTFKGWSDGTNLYQPGAEISDLTGDLTLTAIWLTTTSLTWSAATCTATIASPSNEFPSLTATPEEIKSGVVYESSNTDVATIDANGNIRLLTAGETTITANFVENATHAASSAEYTLTVVASDNCKWVETDINDIDPYDEVVVTMTNGITTWALDKTLSDKGYPLAIVLDEISNATLSNNELSTGIKWVITGDSVNGYVLSPIGNQTNWLYCGKTTLKVGTSAGKNFIISDGFLTYIDPTEYWTRYLAVSTTIQTPDWRPYEATQTVIKDKKQSLRFYKKTCLPENEYWITYNLENVTCTNDPKIETITSTSEDFELTFEAADGYILTDDIEVQMVGGTLTTTWDKDNGVLTINEPDGGFTGNITISLAACLSLAAPENLAANEITSSSVTLSWDAVADAQSYEVLVLDENNDEISETTTECQITLTDLQVNSYYVWGVTPVADGYCGIQETSDFQTLQTYDVTFDNNGHENAEYMPETQTVDDDNYAEEPNDDPSDNGYSFGGWYDNKNCEGDPFNFSETPITANTVLYAKWDVVTYNITYASLYGAENNANNPTTYTIETPTITFLAPSTRDGYIFSGWSPAALETGNYGDKTITAIWEKGKIVTWEADGEVVTSQTYASGDALVLPTKEPEACQGSVFVGWTAEQNYSHPTDAPDFITAGGAVNADTTYYAVYAEAPEGEPIEKITKTFTFSEYTAGTQYAQDEEHILNEDLTIYTTQCHFTDELRIYSSSAHNGYVVSNKLPGKIVSMRFNAGNKVDVLLVYGKTADSDWTLVQELSITSTSYNDYTVDFSETNCTYFKLDVKGANQIRITSMTITYMSGSGEPSAAYANYSTTCSATYRVSYEFAEGEGTCTNESVKVGNDYKICTNEPTKTGYTFQGWNDGTTIYAAGDTIANVQSDITLTAVWEANTYEITWWSNGVEYITTTHTYDQALELPADPYTCYGAKTFIGWTEADEVNENGEGIELITTSTNPSDHKTYYAVFADEEVGEPEKHDATLSFANTAQRTSFSSEQQVWEQNGITLTNDKASSANDVANYVNPVRFYAASSINLTAPGNITTIVFACTESGYATAMKNSAGNSATVDGTVVTVNLDGSSNTFDIAKVTAQIRLSSLTVTYLSDPELILSNYTTTPTGCAEMDVAENAYVTSANGQSVKVNVPVKANNFANDMTITATVEDGNFSVANVSAVTDGACTVTLAYKPTASNTTESATVTLTAKADDNEVTSTTFTVNGRSLPENFVIATKVGATWYALPANMNGATNPEGVVIDVDETTMTAIAPNTTVYTLFPVKTTTGSGDRYAQYGDRVRFSAVNNEYKGLWTSSSESTIRNYAVIDDVKDGSSDASYEWKITTTIVNDNWQYTLQTDQSNNQKYLRYWTAASGGAKWGTYASGNDKLYFLLVTETKPFDYKVVEWYPTKVLIQTEAAITNPIVKIGGVLVDNVTCTNKGGKLYEISGLPLVNNPTKVLTLSYTADEVTYTNSKVVPIILSRETMTISTGELFASLTKEVYNYADLVVRDGATLRMDSTQEANTLWDVTIYPTSKISVPESKKLTVHSLTFFGGIDEIYNGSTYTLNKYGVPQLSLKGTLKKSISTIDYLMRVDSKQMYSLTVPYDVQLADIKYWDGTNIVLGDELWVSAYDGASRAQNQGNGKNWIYETDFESKLGAATLKAGVGYTISAELQNGVGSEYSILRMPMTSNVANDATEAAKTVAVTAWGKDANVTDNHKGWNLVGNPYMASIKGADDDDLVLGYLQETGTGPWGWVEKTYRYVTIPSDNGEWYYQQKFTEAVLPPFKNFFVQIGTTGELAFGLSTRQNAPSRYLQQEQSPREVEFELLLSNEAQSDNMGLLISEEYTPAYEINADLEKMIGQMSVYSIYNGYQLAYTALSPLNAMEEIPLGYVVPATGEYTFALDEHGDLDEIEHIYLLDYDKNTTTDLMEDIYTFAATEKKSDKRFAISVVLKAEEEVETPTQLETLEWESDRPYKFIYQDKMYILRNGVIYDAMGKQVQTINK